MVEEDNPNRSRFSPGYEAKVIMCYKSRSINTVRLDPLVLQV